jgi:hypothetical protein
MQAKAAKEERVANTVIGGGGPRVNSLAGEQKKGNLLLLRFCQEKEVNKRR